jgi:hypothetical protein
MFKKAEARRSVSKFRIEVRFIQRPEPFSRLTDFSAYGLGIQVTRALNERPMQPCFYAAAVTADV